jgi:TetR/AcrR family transcriptional regulator, regulator of cefoperazone and chloramphenicol sensitivity
MSISSRRLKNLQASNETDGDDTQSRLIEAASSIFAERGYQSATTREICIRARANAAAVNYHFGGKLGLYKAALKSVIALEELGVEKLALSAMPAEQALRAFILAMFDNLGGSEALDQRTLYTRLMAHELSDPTPGLALVVNQIIAPRAKLLSGIVARLTAGSATSLQTRMAAHSIMAQVVHYMHARPVIKLLWPKWQMTPAARRQIIEHVINFSLAGLKDLARSRRGCGAKGGRR